MATGRSVRTVQAPPSCGCYGLRIAGLDAAADLLVAAPESWPELAVRLLRARGGGPAADALDGDRALLPLETGGWVEVVRSPARADFHLPGPMPDANLVHPYLAPAAAVAARWAGRESFHAAAVVVDGGAWAVIGDKEHGKSSTMAALALAGHPVLADDLLVVDGGDAFAGPRCIDLREESAARLGVGEPLGRVGMRERWRLPLGPAPARVPLRGFVTLAWADNVRVEPLRGPERLLALLPLRSVRLAPEAPEAMIELAALPVLRLERPRRWESMDAALGRLLEAIRART